MLQKNYRAYSFWLDSTPDDLAPRPALGSNEDVDVAIVGGGYTGLWTAYYLRKADPSLRVAVLEREICGFGASGRNGGWCSALFAGSRERTARRHGREAAIALQKVMFDAVDEVGRVAKQEEIDAHFFKGGTLTLATSKAQLQRVRSWVDYEREWGFGEQDFVWLNAEEARSRVDVRGCLGAAFTPHCASIHPARLARGLATSIEAKGVKIYEGTPAVSIEPHLVRTPHASVRAEVVVRATEAYTPQLPGMRRHLVPIYSLMIATEPLGESVWNRIGWSGRETFTDGRHLLIYAQRTADNRVAMGGRGAPYHFASRVDDSFDHEPEVFEELEHVLHTVLPATESAQITHRWGGPVGIPRDWYSSVGLDPETGLAWAGGYVGDGVSTTNLAGRTLADLIGGRDSELTSLPWVNHRSGKWVPEPLRWLGANLMLRVSASADRVENRTGKPAHRARLISLLTGH
jgi:glycine/D-amino acid oxidase-like deaminating enzyme